jgi:trk system potassium uptake protein TrkH
VTLVLSYLLLPLVLAMPMEQAVSATRFINVYLDMVSALTTTGASCSNPRACPMRCICGARRWDGSAAC